MIVAALDAAAATLLVVAGLAKIRTPAPAATMLATFVESWRVSRARARLAARAAGVVECVVGVAALVFGGRVALTALAAAYLVLTVVALRLATGPRRAACGCFGAADGTVGAPHVAFDLVCLVVAVTGAARASGSVATLFGGSALAGVTAVLQVLVLSALGYLSITALPALAAARREVEGIR